MCQIFIYAGIHFWNLYSVLFIFTSKSLFGLLCKIPVSILYSTGHFESDILLSM